MGARMSDLQDIIATSSIRAFNSGYRSGYESATRDTAEQLRQGIIKNLLADGVISTNADVSLLERVVEIVEAS
jgi:hypothetical protein